MRVNNEEPGCFVYIIYGEVTARKIALFTKTPDKMDLRKFPARPSRSSKS